MPPTQEQDPPPSLTDVIKACGGGQFHDEATAELQALVKDIRRVGETIGGKPKGMLTLKIKLTLDRGIFDVDAGITVTSPAQIRARTIMYDRLDGSLVKNEPNQLSLSGVIKDATPDPRDIRSARDA